jgi:endonuclease/exonuclease/phosphatase family metal-dependent hydrolase
MSRMLLVIATAAALFAPAVAPSPAAAATVDVMSYNIQWGAPSGRRLEAVAKVIAGSGADVAGLQEVRRFARNAKGGNYRCEDQARRVASLLERFTGDDWHWKYVANYSRRQSSRHCRGVTSHNREEGVLIVSRYPIVRAASYRLPYGRGMAEATVRVPGSGTVTVYTTHLDWRSNGKRTVQAREIVRIAKRRGGPVFVTGDMNARPSTTPMRVLAGAMRDTWAEKGVGKGVTRNNRIDYVWYRGGARPKSVKVIQSRASDHRPVLARFSVN